VLRIQVDAVDLDRAVVIAQSWVVARAREYVCFANVHGAVESWRDASLPPVYAGAGLTVPDGMPLVWLGRLRGHGGVGRVYGPDFTLILCATLAARQGRVFLYGGAPGVSARLGEVLTSRFPGLVVAGTESPPFRDLAVEEAGEMVTRINAARPDVVLVGLGCPKQERWMAAHRPQLDAPVLLGVGAAFDFLTGAVAQAPRWMRGSGLEWLFRLMQEPRRLWRRYLVYNPLFVALALAQLLTGRDSGPPSP
jgi:N-acetylglucosaminyldiphosphoundecaprenol N-acetyl-beta-D-mannosaminyltransferase